MAQKGGFEPPYRVKRHSTSNRAQYRYATSAFSAPDRIRTCVSVTSPTLKAGAIDHSATGACFIREGGFEPPQLLEHGF